MKVTFKVASSEQQASLSFNVFDKLTKLDIGDLLYTGDEARRRFQAGRYANIKKINLSPTQFLLAIKAGKRKVWYAFNGDTCEGTVILDPVVPSDQGLPENRAAGAMKKLFKAETYEPHAVMTGTFARRGYAKYLLEWALAKGYVLVTSSHSKQAKLLFDSIQASGKASIRFYNTTYRMWVTNDLNKPSVVKVVLPQKFADLLQTLETKKARP